MSAGTLLIQDETGKLSRLGADGVLRSLPPVRVDGVPGGPDQVAAGPGQLLLGIINRPDPTEVPRVILSRDGGRTWQPEQLPP